MCPELKPAVLHVSRRDRGRNSAASRRSVAINRNGCGSRTKTQLETPFPAPCGLEIPPSGAHPPALHSPAEGEPALHSLGEGGSISPPPQHPRARNGKVARLPYLERDMVNRMLRNNIPYAKIKGALEEHDIRVTERNISNWKTRGGYKEWCAEQDRALETRLLQDNLLEHLRKNDASQLPEIGLQAAATRLSQFLLTPLAAQQLIADPQGYIRNVTTLCRLSSEILDLQKYRDTSAKELGSSHNPERLKREDEARVETTRNIYSAAKLGNTVHDPDIPHRNYFPKT